MSVCVDSLVQVAAVERYRQLYQRFVAQMFCPPVMPAQLESLDGTATNTKRVQRDLPTFNPVVLLHMQKIDP
jgi:hypothetical protein